MNGLQTRPRKLKEDVVKVLIRLFAVTVSLVNLPAQLAMGDALKLEAKGHEINDDDYNCERCFDCAGL